MPLTFIQLVSYTDFALNLYTMAWIGIQSLLESIVNQFQPEDLDELKYVLKENFPGKFHSDFAASRQCLKYLIMKEFPG